MRTDWVVCSLSVLVSMAVAIVVFGQHTQLTSLSKPSMELNNQVGKLNAVLQDRIYLRALVEKQLEQWKKTVEELEAEVAKLTPVEQKKKTESEACQADKTKKNEELKEQTDTEAQLKAKTEAWKGKLATLKQELEHRSKVCEFVKKDPAAQKLCDRK